MNNNPINLILRFVLEIAMLIALSFWGWHLTGGWIRYITALGLPLIASVIWSVFRIQNDPKPAPVQTPGMVRLLIEWLLFSLAVWSIYHMGYVWLSIAMGILLNVHYEVSYDRTLAMIKNKPYKELSR